jgi:hypothetical protein
MTERIVRVPDSPRRVEHVVQIVTRLRLAPIEEQDAWRALLHYIVDRMTPDEIETAMDLLRQ